jgi:protein translocase SecG subunit
MNILITILPYIQLVLSALLIATVLLQQSDASLGSSFGGSDGANTGHTRRGAEKFFFNATIVLAVLFAASALLAVVIR